MNSTPAAAPMATVFCSGVIVGLPPKVRPSPEDVRHSPAYACVKASPSASTRPASNQRCSRYPCRRVQRPASQRFRSPDLAVQPSAFTRSCELATGPAARPSEGRRWRPSWERLLPDLLPKAVAKAERAWIAVLSEGGKSVRHATLRRLPPGTRRRDTSGTLVTAFRVSSWNVWRPQG